MSNIKIEKLILSQPYDFSVICATHLHFLLKTKHQTHFLTGISLVTKQVAHPEHFSIAVLQTYLKSRA